ncbi:MAG: GNAT family N-acetyltransferase [Candidatus Poribacteria bacterium]|nr:GNAT family N-acetyltransferase [Candidatus Poribacteria bacterium]
MSDKIIYRHWQPGDDDAILELLLPAEQVHEDSYRTKFEDWHVDIDAEAIRLALLNDRVVGHVLGEPTPLCVERKIQIFGWVSHVFVAPDMRQQGIATHLMHELHSHFKQKGYRGSILDTDEAAAIRLYQKVGYQFLTRELRTQLPRNPSSSQLKWTEVNQQDLNAFPQLDERWARRNFPVEWVQQNIVKVRRFIKVHRYNMSMYRVLRQGQKIVGYSMWEEPSEYYPDGLIRDPIAPDVDPMEVLASVQATIPTTRTLQTAEGGRYEASLRLCGCTLEPTAWVLMLLLFGQEIDLTGYHRTAWW